MSVENNHPYQPPIAELSDVAYLEANSNSKLGLTSLIISIVSGVLIIVTFAIAGYLEATSPGSLDDESAGTFVIGLSIIAFLGTSLLSAGLGIGSLFQKERKKSFGIIGTLVSMVTIIATVSLILWGLSIE